MIHLIHSTPKNAGGVIITDLSGGIKERDTWQCGHCGKHFIFKRGSGKNRGFCMHCMNPTCGSKQCDPCKPYGKD